MSLMAPAVPAPAVQPIARGGLIQRCGGISCPPGTCNHTDDPADATVQRSVDASAAVGGSGVPASVLRVLDSVGTPLDAPTRASMEARLGHDFGHVRVHTDAEAARSAKSIRAQAYTFGSHVVMGEGRFQPHTPVGVRLLAHELTHVVQQAGASAPARSVSDPDDPSEREAERTADFTGDLHVAPKDRVHRTTDEQQEMSLDQSADGLFSDMGSDGSGSGDGLGDGSGDGLGDGLGDGDFGQQSIGGGGQSGGGGASDSFDGTPTGAAVASRPTPMICSRPIAVTGLGAFRHAFVNDPPANYAIREPLYSGNGISGCANTTDASGPPDDPATSTCKPCLPPPGQTLDDLSSCLRNVHLGYASPGIYRNLPDPGDGWSWGPNSNSYVAAMALCCDSFDPSGLGSLPGWNHSPARPCPSTAPSPASPGGGSGPAAPAAPADPASSPAAPDGQCYVESGPAYTPSGTIPVTNAGGRKQASFTMAAAFGTAFVTLPPRRPACCEVRQYIKWNRAYQTWRGGPPHSGFPSSATYDTWYEDRDSGDKRYGHRSGVHSDPIAGCGDEYLTAGRRDQVNGDSYCGADAPQSSAPAGATYNFQLKVIDTCNGDQEKASSSIITVNW